MIDPCRAKSYPSVPVPGLSGSVPTHWAACRSRRILSSTGEHGTLPQRMAATDASRPTETYGTSSVIKVIVVYAVLVMEIMSTLVIRSPQN